MERDKMVRRGKKKCVLKSAAILGLCFALAGVPVFSHTAVAAEAESRVAPGNAENLTQTVEGVTASANGYESGTAFTAEKAIDGSVDRDSTKASRWASNVQQNEEKWLTVQFPEAVTVQTVAIEWERRNCTKYEIQYSQDGSNWETAKAFSEAPEDYRQTIVLDNAIRASYIRVLIQEFSSTIDMDPGDSWDNVSIYELEIYSEEVEDIMSMDEVINSLQIPEIEAGDAAFELPAVPAGYEIELIGADYEQIISDDLTIYQPLTDTDVTVNFRISNDTETRETAAYTVTVPGKKSVSAGNEKPVVIPELAEWDGGAGEFTITDASRIVIDPAYGAELSFMAEEFKADYQDVTGRTIEIVSGTEPGAHDFYFTLGSSDEGLGEEGYLMTVGEGVSVEAADPVGAYWSTRTILQILSQTGDSIVQGTARDYPKYEVRGLMLDVGRKAISKEFLETLIKEMAWYKMSDFQIHLSDNAFSDQYASVEQAKQAYSGFRLESDVKEGGLNAADLTSKDMYYTKDEFRDLIQTSRQMGIDIVPEFDTPAHSLPFTKVRPDLIFAETLKGVDHLNLHEKYNESLTFVQSVWDEYLEGANPVFDSETIVNIGTDEYDGTYREEFRQYTDDMLEFIQDKGNTVRLWGSLTQRSGTTPVRSEGVQMNLWSTSWANPQAMYNDGFELINMVDNKLYIVPGVGTEYYHDYLEIESLYNNWQPNVMGNTTIPAGSEQMLGSAFAVWNDKSGKLSNGISELDIYDRINDAMPALANKMWGDAEDLSYTELKTAAEEIGVAPNNNPRYEASSKNRMYVDYDFDGEDKAEDISGNSRDLTAQENVTFENDAITLNGGESYAETPIEKLGTGNRLAFDITLTEEAQPGDILFETDSEYGTHDIRIMEDGTLGFTREMYDYSFGYTIPVGETVHLEIATEMESTVLYVNGEAYAASGTWHETGTGDITGITRATFVLPVARIGSLTNAVRAQMDNIQLKQGPTLMDSSKFTVSADSEQDNGGIEKAFDNDESTFWHSSWNPYIELPATVTIDLGETAAVSRFTYLPRQDNNNNGQITRYSLYYSETGENDDWHEIIVNGTWAADASLKSADFSPVEARYLRFEAIDGTGDKSHDAYACAAEFRVYADTQSIERLTMSAGASDPDGGTVEVSAGAVLPGDDVTFTAVPNSGYIFEGWYDESGSKVSDQATYTFPAERDTVLTAHFTKSEVPEPITVTVTPTEMTLTVDGTARITATPSQSGAELTWSSSDESVATVDSSGNVTAVGVGTAVITVRTSDGNTATCTVTVKSAGQTDPTDPADPTDPSDPANPTDPADPSDPEESVPGHGLQTGASQSPQTGDHADGVIFLLAMAAALGAVVLVKRRQSIT